MMSKKLPNFNNYRITIKSQSTAVNSYGAIDTNESNRFQNVGADIKWGSQTQIETEDRLAIRNRLTLYVRYNRTISVKDIVEFDGNTYDIDGISQETMFGRNKVMSITVTQRNV